MGLSSLKRWRKGMTEHGNPLWKNLTKRRNANKNSLFLSFCYRGSHFLTTRIQPQKIFSKVFTNRSYCDIIFKIA